MSWDDRGRRLDPCLTVGCLPSKYSAEVISNWLISTNAPIVKLRHLSSSLKTFKPGDTAVDVLTERSISGRHKLNSTCVRLEATSLVLKVTFQN